MRSSTSSYGRQSLAYNNSRATAGLATFSKLSCSMSYKNRFSTSNYLKELFVTNPSQFRTSSIDNSHSNDERSNSINSIVRTSGTSIISNDVVSLDIDPTKDENVVNNASTSNDSKVVTLKDVEDRVTVQDTLDNVVPKVPAQATATVSGANSEIDVALLHNRRAFRRMMMSLEDEEHVDDDDDDDPLRNSDMSYDDERDSSLNDSQYHSEYNSSNFDFHEHKVVVSAHEIKTLYEKLQSLEDVCAKQAEYQMELSRNIEKEVANRTKELEKELQEKNAQLELYKDFDMDKEIERRFTDFSSSALARKALMNEKNFKTSSV